MPPKMALTGKYATYIAWRYLGWVLLAVYLFKGKPDGYSVLLAVVAIAYFLLLAPVWCGAITRDDQMCRNNSQGLLRGCHLRQHKKQKITGGIGVEAAKALWRRFWRESHLAAVGVAAAVVAALAAVAQVFVTAINGGG